MKEERNMLDADAMAARGGENFLKGYNCSQSVVKAFADVYGIDDRFVSLASSFGGGMARMRMTCGACSGMFMLAGLQTGSPVPNDLASRKANYAVVQRLGKAFKEENGSMLCSELLGLRTGAIQPPTPAVRDAEYYRSRPCKRLIESACRIYAAFYNECVSGCDGGQEKGDSNQ